MLIGCNDRSACESTGRLAHLAPRTQLLRRTYTLRLMRDGPPPLPPMLPHAPVQRWIAPFTRFFEIEAAGGVALLICTAVALILANSPYAQHYAHLWHLELSIGLGEWVLSMSLHHWITDGLMTLFFFVMGLEIKRELVAGELRDPKKAALPAVAALGGMIGPALIFLLLQWNTPGAAGWGVPIATDIAFVVALVAVFGKRVPVGLKVFILSLAIADDIGAVIVIALFYTSEIALLPLGFAAAGFGLTYFFNRIGVRRVPVYVVVGAGIWLAFLASGVHPTVAGVMLGLLTPASAWIGNDAFLDVASRALHRLRGDAGSAQVTSHVTPRERQQAVGQLATTAYESISPLERLEFALHPWVAFVIVPLFALANVGVTIDPAAIGEPILMAIAAGLLLGKPVGIVVFSFIAVKMGFARLPAGVNWPIMAAAGCLAGIGFTMSLLIAGLSLDGTLLEAAKIGVLLGSLASAILGSLLLLMFLRPCEPKRKVCRGTCQDGADAV